MPVVTFPLHLTFVYAELYRYPLSAGSLALGVEFLQLLSVVISDSVFLCSACILAKMWLGQLSWQQEAPLPSCSHLS